jgi:hypothetical protein
MAERNLLKTGAGMLGQPVRIVIGKDGQLNEQTIVVVNSNIEQLYRKINGHLSFGDGSQSSLTGNVYGQWIEFTTPSNPDEQFQVDHGLGVTPFARFVARQDAAGHLYDSNIFGWGPTRVYFKCDTASVLMKIALFA